MSVLFTNQTAANSYLRRIHTFVGRQTCLYFLFKTALLEKMGRLVERKKAATHCTKSLGYNGREKDKTITVSQTRISI